MTPHKELREAHERVAAYLERYSQATKNPQDLIHEFDGGPACGGVELTPMDLRALLTERDSLAAQVQQQALTSIRMTAEGQVMRDALFVVLETLPHIGGNPSSVSSLLCKVGAALTQKD